MEKEACIFNIQKFSLHDGPGIRTVVFFKGCPMHCYWCANPESQNSKPETMWDDQKKMPTTVGEYRSIESIIEEVMKDEAFYLESGGGVTLSGGEVLFQAEAAIELLSRLKEKGIHTASETTGFAKESVFKQYIEQVDLLYFDVKHYEEKQHKKGTGVSLQPILNNLTLALQQNQQMIVRIPVIPNYNDGLVNAEGFALLFNQLGIKTVELLPFHQFGEKKYTYLDRPYEMANIPQLHTEDLAYFKNHLEEHGIACRIH
ncbi:formate acetyltransferase activating enzyme [Enterococcus florum]|uniref:Formate acetyltransferase activating enzyme n=1 Tax=Enterococcus florum TaxID=2480627 RepID=A0A4P5PQ63_9ENTE|nr:glycyl-radical enzyme activating protein [Enterococcus florum]GCF95183.1 formate acetyltransferase activating enzyme [Enterococcus florum]